MKTFFKSILAVAVCASLFAACSKDDTVSDPSNGRKVTMTVTASSELESASGSRTTYDPLTGKISWNETGEYLQVFETAASKTTYANSQEGTVSDGTAKFAVSFPENTNTPLVYNAVYPASGSQRNYTMYYDKSTYTAYWVAYPLAKGHMGNGRSDKWQRNPGLAESEQINVWSSSYGVNLGATTSDGYDSSKEFYAGGTRYPTPTATVRTNWSYRPITQPIPRRRFRTNSTAVFGSSSKAASEISLRLRTRYMW